MFDRKFKSGDRVTVTNPTGRLAKLSYMKTGIIINFDERSNDYTVDFDDGGRWFLDECELSKEKK